mmetsp:Transcript_37152/g.54655  ORF Transcript_37152/g.54655 Transcript_37152/m.54655 type:complete len:158 (-) Transcript_37152:489-962(-)
MTYQSRGRSIVELILAVTFASFLIGFIAVLCIGNYFRAKKAMERQRQRRLERLGLGGNASTSSYNSRTTDNGSRESGSYESGDSGQFLSPSTLGDENQSLLGSTTHHLPRRRPERTQQASHQFDDDSGSLIFDDLERSGEMRSMYPGLVPSSEITSV